MKTTRYAPDGSPPPRGGFALLTVLWIMVAAASLGLTISLAAREAIGTARNRTASTRAMWRAHDCLERARAAVHHVLEDAQDPLARTASPWLSLDTLVVGSGIMTDLPCRVELRAAGTALDVNRADAEMLRALVRAAGIPFARADSMTDALLDWRDADEIVRPLGAESAWYAASHRATPRNAPFAADHEIALVRGFDRDTAVRALLGVEQGRILFARAPLAVLAALPGFGEEALARIAERRARGAPLADPLALAAELSPEGRASIVSRYAELAGLTTSEPDAWIVTSRGHDDGSPLTAAIEVRLVRAGTRAAIVRRREWIE